jgi:hypothetical protein
MAKSYRSEASAGSRSTVAVRRLYCSGRGPAPVLLLLSVGLLATTAGPPACAPNNNKVLSFLAALPSAELVALGELVEAQASTGAPDAAALIEELSCLVGDRRELLLHALVELGHHPAQPQRRTEDGGQRIRGSGGGGSMRPFIYLLLMGEDSRLRGVSTAFLCLLLQGLAVGPSPGTDAGVATCHRFGALLSELAALLPRNSRRGID